MDDINNEDNINFNTDSDDDINQLKSELDKKKKALDISNTLNELENDVAISDYKIEDADDIEKRFQVEDSNLSSRININSNENMVLTDEIKNMMFTKNGLDNTAMLQFIQDQINEGHFETGEIHKASDIDAERLKFEQEENERILKEQEEENNALIDPEHVIKLII